MGEPVPPDDSDSDDNDVEPRMKIPPSIFKGVPGEHPDAHVFAAEDWMEALHFRENQYIDKFKHTLNHLAREWYHSLDLGEFRGIWREFTRAFSRYFSTQGRNIKHLHERWQTFSFDPINAWFFYFFNEIFHILMYTCIQKPVYPHKHIKYLPMNLFGSLLTITYRHLPNWQSIWENL